MYLHECIPCLVLGACTSQPLVSNQTKKPYIKIARSDISYEMPGLILPVQPYDVSIVLMHYNAVIYIITNGFWEMKWFCSVGRGPQPCLLWKVYCGHGRGIQDGGSGVAHSLHSCVF